MTEVTEEEKLEIVDQMMVDWCDGVYDEFYDSTSAEVLEEVHRALVDGRAAELPGGGAEERGAHGAEDNEDTSVAGADTSVAVADTPQAAPIAGATAVAPAWRPDLSCKVCLLSLLGRNSSYCVCVVEVEVHGLPENPQRRGNSV